MQALNAHTSGRSFSLLRGASLPTGELISGGGALAEGVGAGDVHTPADLSRFFSALRVPTGGADFRRGRWREAGARVASGHLRAGQRSWPCGGIMAGALARGRGRGRDIGGWRGRGSGGAIWRGMLSDLYSADYSA